MQMSPASLPGVPVAVLGGVVPSSPPCVASREVIVRVARATLDTKVFLESLPVGGPSERIRALLLPPSADGSERTYRALLPLSPPGFDAVYVPLAIAGTREIRGETLRLSDTPARAVEACPGACEQRSTAAPATIGPPRMELLAHVEARLPKATVFGRTPDGIRMAFYVADGEWSGPRIHARYRSEGGDWLLVREDGVGIPNLRATLETEDGALLYYQLTGTIELGSDGFARALANDLPEVAPFSLAAKITTASERWSWLNRLVLVGAGAVQLKTGTVVYEIYSIVCDPSALQRWTVERPGR